MPPNLELVDLPLGTPMAHFGNYNNLCKIKILLWDRNDFLFPCRNKPIGPVFKKITRI